MTSTSPDGLTTPDQGDPFNLSTDLAILANDVQETFIRRANTYIGTVEERNAFAAPNGTIWVDTNGDRYVWVRWGTQWRYITENSARPLPFAQAQGQVTISVLPNNPNATASITFPTGRFTQTPLIQVTKQSSGAAKYIPYISSKSSTGATIGLYSGDGTSASHSVVVAWTAIQMTSSSASG